MMAVMLVASGFLGAFLVWYQGLRCWLEFNRQLDRGESPALPVMNGICVLLAAVLLATPGFITGFIGLLLLIPPVRMLFIAYIRLRFEVYRSRMVRRPPESSTSKQPPEIIDV